MEHVDAPSEPHGGSAGTRDASLAGPPGSPAGWPSQQAHEGLSEVPTAADAEPPIGAEPSWRPALADVSPAVAGLVGNIQELAGAELPPMGLSAGDRPAADVDALLGGVASLEYELARRMAAAARAGALPLVGDGAMPLARYWSAAWSRRLARTGEFAARYPAIAQPWASGVITSEHVDTLARRAERLSEAEMAAVIEQLTDRWGRHSPESLARFVQRVIRALHPPPDPEPDESDAYASRSLSFSILGDSVILAGSMPRLEGEAVMAAVDAWAEKLRSAADDVPAAARRLDGLVSLVNLAAAAESLPNRGGLPVALSVTLDQTPAGDSVWSTWRGHTLTQSEQRFVACSAHVTPVAVDRLAACERTRATGAQGGANHRPTLAMRIAGLAATLLDEQVPLAVGRTHRNATAAQRRALAVRDAGCVIPGCRVPAEACQAHHREEWNAGGRTDLSNLVLLCWTHHRQVDLGMWAIDPANPNQPDRGAWRGNNNSPWVITRTSRTRWRL
jgi:hypothetical protein